MVEISAGPSEPSFVSFVSLSPLTVEPRILISIPRAAAGRKKKKTIKRNDFLFLYLLILNEFIHFSFFPLYLLAMGTRDRVML